VTFQVAIDAADSRPIESAVGVDLGLKVFAYQSDGVIVPNPNIARRVERKMRERQRALARCKRGSNRRHKIKAAVSRLHTKITNARTTWLHQQSARMVRDYDLIVAEDLNVSGMLRNPTLARSISDASWSTFLGMVAYKAEKAGGTFKIVNPRNTSQNCSGCGQLVPKRLAARTHECPSCGLVIDRDHNAALNILRAVVGPGQRNVAHQSVRAAGNLKETAL
jgi:putative transposase